MTTETTEPGGPHPYRPLPIHRSRVTLALLLYATTPAPAPLSAQSLRYDAPADPVLYESLNPWLMYWLTSDGDTVGQPVTAFAVERWDWTRRADALRVTIAALSIGIRRTVEVDTLDVDPTGRVTAINASTNAPRGRWDLLPYLPAGGAATLGATWTNAIGFGGELAPTGQRYEARRAYRLERVFDSAGVRLAEVSSRGDVHYRDGYWVDSAAGTVRWLDVRGPVTERALVRLADGALQFRTWRMDLRGVGGNPAVRRDSVRAGLRSAGTLRRVSHDRFAVLSRPLEGSDTTYTVLGQELLFLHVVDSTPHRVTSGMVRADGWVTTAASSFAAGAPRSHEMTWTSHVDSVIRLAVTTSGDSLRVSGSRSTTHPVPTGRWAVADHGMSEYLVPVLLGLDRTWTFQDFAIYRPFLDQWEAGTARVRELEEALLAEIVLGDGVRSFVIFSEDGALLYTEGGYDQPAFRLPRPGTAARTTLDRILQEFQQQGGDDGS